MAKYLTPLQVAQGLKNLSTPTYAPTTTVPGTDYLTATGLTNQGNIAQANANNAYNNSMMNGLFTLGGASLLSPAGTFSGLFSNPGLFGAGGGAYGAMGGAAGLGGSMGTGLKF
jgi:hypothetical protein